MRVFPSFRNVLSFFESLGDGSAAFGLDGNHLGTLFARIEPSELL
jgi:hypothetical protein